MKILVVGSGQTNAPNANVIVKALQSRGVVTSWMKQLKYPSLKVIWKFDVVYGVYLQSCARALLLAEALGKKTVFHCVGSDAYAYARSPMNFKKRVLRHIVHHAFRIFYVSGHLIPMIGVQGSVLPFPIRVQPFNGELPKRDILYYCPSGVANEKIYRLDWISEYVKVHPNETVTLLGNSEYPATYHLPYNNVNILPFIQQSDMPKLYASHKKLIRMTTEDGLPRMVDEALLCGLQVDFNGKEMRRENVAPERDFDVFARKLEQELLSL